MRLLIDLDGVADFSRLKSRVKDLGFKILNHCGEVRAIDISGISLDKMGELTFVLLEFDCRIVGII